MDFINRSFSGTFKIILTIIAVLIFIRIIPLLVVVGFIAWAGVKGMKYFNSRKYKRANKHENMDVNSSMYAEKDSFDFTDKNIVDVEYEEIKK